MTPASPFARVTLAPPVSVLRTMATMLGLGAPIVLMSIVLFPWFIAVALIYLGACVVRLVEVLWLEPHARALGIDDEGFLDPASGARVRWEDVASIERRFVRLAWTLPNGRSFSAPRSLFADPVAAEERLRGRVGRGLAGPYRGAG